MTAALEYLTGAVAAIALVAVTFMPSIEMIRGML